PTPNLFSIKTEGTITATLPTVVRFLLSCNPQQPESTLFPYTTLFRSGRVRPEEQSTLGHRSDRPREVLHWTRLLDESARARLEGDRKSTRLNSSHLGISYAVFCLKKKKMYSCHTVYNNIFYHHCHLLA